jgi:DNA-binding LytR/AlgR family response regulator
MASSTSNRHHTVWWLTTNRLARRNLTVLLRRDPDIGSVTECGSGLDAIEEIRKSKPDLVFLDVQMPECDGFDVLEFLGSESPSTIIFVTAYDEYALRAFEAGALDYLLKPFDDARFGRALNRAKDKLAHYTPLATATLGATGDQESGPGGIPGCRGHRLDRGCGLLRLLARGQ